MKPKWNATQGKEEKAGRESRSAELPGMFLSDFALRRKSECFLFIFLSFFLSFLIFFLRNICFGTQSYLLSASWAFLLNMKLYSQWI